MTPAPARPPAAGRRRFVLFIGCAAVVAVLPVVPARVRAQGSGASGDGVQALRDFVRRVQSGRATFTQTVVSPDGTRRKTSSGRFEFVRPNRFRFDYDKPFPQLIVADGEKVWIHDPDLNQASARNQSQLIGTTPAAILAGSAIDAEFDLAPQASQDGLAWVQAMPKQRDGPIRSLRVGFRGSQLAVFEILDSFGQRSLLRFDAFEANVPIPPDRFRFTPPPGTDVLTS